MNHVCIMFQMHPLWSRVLLQVLLPNPTASYSAHPHAATSSQVHTQRSASRNIGAIFLIWPIIHICCLFLSGSGNSLAESGRSDSSSTLRSPREERTDVLQLRKVKRHSVLFIAPSLAFLTHLFFASYLFDF